MCILMFSTWRVAGLLFRYFPCPVRQARTFRSGGSGGQDRSHGALFQMRRGTENFEECSVKTVVILIFQSKMPENFLSVISWRQSCLCSLLLTLKRKKIKLLTKQKASTGCSPKFLVNVLDCFWNESNIQPAGL